MSIAMRSPKSARTGEGMSSITSRPSGVAMVSFQAATATAPSPLLMYLAGQHTLAEGAGGGVKGARRRTQGEGHKRNCLETAASKEPQVRPQPHDNYQVPLSWIHTVYRRWQRMK